jgi:ubiquinone/menaquinone biosynthesis C-methylase UbiE
MTTRPMPGARRYDLKLWIASRGRERVFRERQLDLARIEPGDTVLDLGCGTGTLAIAAARRVGQGGAVHAVDPAEHLLARARKKARRAKANVTFEVGAGGALAFADESFDVVLTSLVLHHLSHDELRHTVHEIRRVLKPGGRALLVDIGGAQDPVKRTLHAPHGGGRHVFDLEAVATRLGDVGLRQLEIGPIESEMPRLERLVYVLAAAA